MREALVASRIEHLPRLSRGKLDFVVDIGANEGQWISALMNFADVRRLEAFEPNPEAFAKLSKRFAQRTHTKLHNFALGDETTSATLNVIENSGLSSVLKPGKIIQQEYAPASEVIRLIPIEILRLDDVLHDDEAIDLIKLDVQGFEHSVLRGAMKTLRRTRVLLIETNFTSHYCGDGTFGTLCNHLSELGLEFWDVSAPYRGSQGQALWADAVFLNRTSTGSA